MWGLPAPRVRPSLACFLYMNNPAATRAAMMKRMAMTIPAVSPAESSFDALLPEVSPPPPNADGLEVGDAVVGAGVGVVVVVGAGVGVVVVGDAVAGAGVGVMDGFCDGAEDAGDTVGENVSPSSVGYVVVGAEVGAVVVGDGVVGDTVVGEEVDGADVDGAAVVGGATGALSSGWQYTPPAS